MTTCGPDRRRTGSRPRAAGPHPLDPPLLLLGDINLAEEVVQDAFAVALEKVGGPAPQPRCWIVTTARHRAIDRLRRESTREARHAQALLLHQQDQPRAVGPVTDDQLRLIFTSCHPALAPDTRTAITLRLLARLEVPETAWAYLVPEPTIAQTPIVALNRAVAVAEVHRPAMALAVQENVQLPGHHLLPATRADLLVRLGRSPTVRVHHRRARRPDTVRSCLRDL